MSTSQSNGNKNIYAHNESADPASCTNDGRQHAGEEASGAGHSNSCADNKSVDKATTNQSRQNTGEEASGMGLDFAGPLLSLVETLGNGPEFGNVISNLGSLPNEETPNGLGPS
jgi:hypothetical protein